MLAQLAAEDVRHVFQRGGLVGGRDEEPDEDKGEGVEAGEEAEELAVAPVDTERDEEGEKAGAGEVPERGPGHANFAAFVGEDLGSSQRGKGIMSVILCAGAEGNRALGEEIGRRAMKGFRR